MSLLPFLFATAPQIGDSFTVIDLGTLYTKIGVFKIEDSRVVLQGVSEVSHGVEHLRFGEIVDTQAVKNSLTKALAQVTSSGINLPAEVVVGVSGENLGGISTVVRLNRTNPNEPIIESELNSLQARIEEVSLSKATKNLYLAGKPLEIVSSKITNIIVDDVAVTDPVGRLGSKIDMYNFAVYATASQLEGIQNLVASLNLKLVTVVPIMYSLIESLESKLHEGMNEVLIDVGGATTEIGLVYGGGLVALGSVSIGGAAITRAIADVFSLDCEDAEEFKKTGGWSSADENEFTQQVAEEVQSIMSMWLAGVVLVLSEFPDVKRLPSNVYLTGGGALFPSFKEALLTSGWARELPFISFPKTRLLSEGDLYGIQVQSDKLNISNPYGLISLGFVGMQIKGKND